MGGEVKKIQVSVTLPHKLVVELDKTSGGQSRSELIRDLLEKSIKNEDKKKKNGVVYTPQYLADYVAEKIISYSHMHKDRKNRDNMQVLDPACGDGILLEALEAKLKAINISSVHLTGVDIDKNALIKAQKRFGCNFFGVNANALCPYNKDRETGWGLLKNNGENNHGYDFIIANPPWGADTSSYKNLVNNNSYQLLSGQYDTSDLFIELSLSLLNDSGIAGFIIPDSLFSHDRALLRKFLLKNAEILFIGRFGEKIFKDVNRACAILIFRKKISSSMDDYGIDCFRLPVEERNNIINGTDKLSLVELKYRHKVLYSRFNNDPKHLFNLDVDSTLQNTYECISSHDLKFGDFLCNHRGVELSKKGKIVQCQFCDSWSPASKNEFIKCKNCGKKIETNKSNDKVIIHKVYNENFNPLIVGEDINRYKIDYNLWIDTSHVGINYKNPEIYEGEKIVVRKTGIGVSASIDYTSSYTNQVVYIFKLRPDYLDKIPLEFLLAILNSRAIFFFVSMSNGEIEWKSHPYLTQQQIINIPIPNLLKLPNKDLEIINELSTRLRFFLEKSEAVPYDLDAELEHMVAKIYGLDKTHYDAIFKVLDKAQELIAVKALKNIKISDIFVSKA
ncbi:N-6 DNA methylase [Kosakonia sacchari]|uniref:Eco57I restriction-modification methylase domain-containing protein n=1 Tax=Kosakonia sacchari TaxID=1158459 RepID=UPI0025B1F99D|nr:N-6 DNA methylase [Kosakonia sacchari]MDN2487463.1 N-6 DNA methylase [Kosakonia sacchari]